jgi:hypothetical protein
MQAIIVDRVPIVDPQLATIIRNDAEAVLACPPDAQNTCPTHGKVITSGETLPFAVCVAIIDNPDSTSHVRSATFQILASTALSKVKDILPPSGASGT